MYYEVLAVGPDRGRLLEALAHAGAVSGPLLDHSASEHYCLVRGRAFKWLLWLMGEKRLLAVILFPLDS